MASVIKQIITLQEFFDREAVAQSKHEFYRGEVFDMADGSPAHNRIAFNLLRELGQQLRGKECVGNTSDVMVKAGELYTYPDGSVVCPPIEREEASLEVLVNPKVLIEVLSPSTERYDRFVKLPQYQQLPSVQEILLVQQVAPLVELYVRQGDATLMSFVSGLEKEVVLKSIDCRLPLSQIYEGVELPADPFPEPYPRLVK